MTRKTEIHDLGMAGPGDNAPRFYPLIFADDKGQQYILKRDDFDFCPIGHVDLKPKPGLAKMYSRSYASKFKLAKPNFRTELSWQI